MRLSIIILNIAMFFIMNIDDKMNNLSIIKIGNLDLRPPDLFFMVIVVTAFFIFSIMQRNIFRRIKISINYIYLLLWILLSCFVIGPAYGLAIAKGTLPHLRILSYYSLFFFSLIIIGNEKGIRQFIKLYYLSCIVTCLIIIVSHHFYPEDEDIRLANRLREIVPQITFFFSLAGFIFTKHKKSTMAIMALCVYAMMVNEARGVIITTLIGFIVYIYLIRNELGKNYRLMKMISTILLTIFIIMSVHFTYGIRERFLESYNNIKAITPIFLKGESYENLYDIKRDSDSDTSLSLKLIEYYRTFEEFRKSPLWGLGIGHVYERGWASLKTERSDVAYVHAVANYFLMDTGIIGLVIFVLLIVKIENRFIILWKLEGGDLSKMIGSTCFVILLCIILNSFNGSYLLMLPVISFVVVYSAICEIMLFRINRNNSPVRY